MKKMSDKTLQKLMDKTYKACLQHSELVIELEKEYKNRFGNYPSDIDDDFFIDSFHYGNGKLITVKEMTENALLHQNKII